MQLRQYQLDALDRIAEQPRIIYADAPGTGKTATSLTALEQLGVERALIIAPKNVLRHWQGQAAVWTPDREVVIGHGTPQQRKRARERVLSSNHAALVLNYESFRVDAEILQKSTWDVLVTDEAHRLKNRRAAVTKTAMKSARRADSLLLVTGTPILNRAEELWSLLHMIDPKRWRSFWRWTFEHFDVEQTTFYGKVPQPVTLVKGIKDGHSDIIRSEIGPLMIQRPLEVLLPELPPLIETTLVVELSAAERKLYNELVRKSWTRIEGEVIWTPNEVAKTTRLRQFASDWSSLSPNVTKAGSKVAATAELVRDLDPEQVLVLTAYRATAHRLTALLPDAVTVTDTKGHEREAIIDQFRSGNARVLVGTIAMLGEGVDGLQVASHIVLLDRDWTPAKNDDQIIGRVRRSGQKNVVRAYYIVAAGTIDETVDRALREKRNVIDSILGTKLEDILGGQASAIRL